MRAVFGVAETGSVWLTDVEFNVNALGFLPSISSCCLIRERSSATCTTPTASARNSMRRYGVFMTGPSATADIEGVLIHGAQGIRTLTVVLVPA